MPDSAGLKHITVQGRIQEITLALAKNDIMPGTVCIATVRGQDDRLVVRTDEEKDSLPWFTPLLTKNGHYHSEKDVTNIRLYNSSGPSPEQVVNMSEWVGGQMKKDCPDSGYTRQQAQEHSKGLIIRYASNEGWV